MDPIQKLENDHRIALEKLKILSQSVLELKHKGFSNDVISTISDVVNFITTEVKAHNDQEEQFLFPALEKRLPPDGPTYVMRNEHVHLKDAYERLSGSLKKLMENFNDREAMDILVDTTIFIVSFLTNHINKENHVLFPMARNILTKDEIEEIAKQMFSEKR
jgi:hypothetical protein